jgi:hypothetical protein
LTQHIPPLDEATYAGNLAENVATIEAAAAAAPNEGGDLLGDLLPSEPSPTAPPAGGSGAAPAPRNVLDDLDELLGGGSTGAPAATNGSLPQAAADTKGAGGLGGLDDLLGGPVSSSSTSPAAPPSATSSFVAWSQADHGVGITFDCTPGSAGAVDIIATYVNRGLEKIEDFQVRLLCDCSASLVSVVPHLIFISCLLL